MDRKLPIKFSLNGKEIKTEAPGGATLLEFLRYHLRLTGSKEGCGEGECGACTVLVNNRPVNSCMMMAVQANECEIVTVEGLAKRWNPSPYSSPARGEGSFLSPSPLRGEGVGEGKLHPVQEGFIDKGGVQCGFCIPGMVVSSVATLEKCPDANLNEIKNGLSGNLCRCTGYEKIFRAVEQARDKMKEKLPVKAKPLPKKRTELVKV